MVGNLYIALQILLDGVSSTNDIGFAGKRVMQEEIDRYGPPRRSARYLREQIAGAGWKITDLAFWLGVSRQYLTAVVDDVHRARHWDLALCGLPKLSRKAMAELAALRRSSKPPRKPSSAGEVFSPAEPGMRYHGILVAGSVVVVTASHVGEMAEEGEEGLVESVRCHDRMESYLIAFPSGASDWFGPDDFDELMMETGKMVDLSDRRE